MFSNMTLADWCGVYVVLGIAYAFVAFSRLLRIMVGIAKDIPFVEYAKDEADAQDIREKFDEIKRSIHYTYMVSPKATYVMMCFITIVAAIGQGAFWPIFLYENIFHRKVVKLNEK